MAARNNSKLYYVSNENMSNIKQSIIEESLHFERGSSIINQPANQFISEYISAEQSRARPPVETIKPETNKLKTSQKQLLRPSSQVSQQMLITPAPEPLGSRNQIEVNDTDEKGKQRQLFLGDHIFSILRQRYFQVTKVATDNPNVLYDFYLLQKKSKQPRSHKQIQRDTRQLQKMVPSTRRKMELRLEFERILSYVPTDVYYTLFKAADNYREEKMVQDKLNLLNEEFKKDDTKRRTFTGKVSETLYNQKMIQEVQKLRKTGLSKEELQKEELKEKKAQRREFGKKLSEVYQNAYRNDEQQSEETLQKLYGYWCEMYDHESWGLEWDSETARDSIKQYMIEQVQDLRQSYQKKTGYMEDDGVNLLKHYQQYRPANIHIPANSFKMYLKVYNEALQEQELKRQKEKEELQKRYKLIEQNKQIKQFGRPVSATPLTILAKPKQSSQLKQLQQKFSNDIFIKTLATKESLKKARYPFEYGVYNVEEQVRIKGRIKPEESKKKDEEAIGGVRRKKNNTISSDRLMQSYISQAYTTSRGQFFNLKEQDQVAAVLAEDDLEKNEKWNNLGPVLREAMLIKSYEQKWFRNAILKYTERALKNDYTNKDDKILYGDLITFLNGLSQDRRKDELIKLENTLNVKSAEREREENKKKDNPVNERKQKKQMYDIIIGKAREFAQLRKEEQWVSVREFLRKLFEAVNEEHCELAKKVFNAMSNEKDCPRLLKFFFYRTLKEIDLKEMHHESKGKSHAWIPTKNQPQSFNYKTYNHYATIYAVDRHQILPKPENEQHKQTIWGRKLGKERQMLLMTYDDAHQCIFEPQLSRKPG